MRVGGHEPNVILKDNDLTHKMKLGTERSRQILSKHESINHIMYLIQLDYVDVLKSDAEFLRDIGIMDYSLIIGVSTEEFEVNLNYDGYKGCCIDFF
jgi:1-phosphatidylinositol-4-phosphate 5-kinase